MPEAFICDFVRTPIGRYAGALKDVRADDLGAIPIRALMERNGGVDWEAVDDVYYGCANQAGEDNRNVGRMAALLAGLPTSVPAATINRLCGSGLDAVGTAARAVRSGGSASRSADLISPTRTRSRCGRSRRRRRRRRADSTRARSCR